MMGQFTEESLLVKSLLFKNTVAVVCGMTDAGFSRLEAIEELVEMDKEENGNQSYENMKEVLIEKDMLRNQLKKDAEKSRKRLRMK